MKPLDPVQEEFLQTIADSGITHISEDAALRLYGKVRGGKVRGYERDGVRRELALLFKGVRTNGGALWKAMSPTFFDHVDSGTLDDLSPEAKALLVCNSGRRGGWAIMDKDMLRAHEQHQLLIMLGIRDTEQHVLAKAIAQGTVKPKEVEPGYYKFVLVGDGLA